MGLPGTGGGGGAWGYTHDEEAQAEAAANYAQQQTQDAASVQAADASTAARGGGYNLGNNQYADSLYGPSAVRADETQKERIAEQRANYFYGGTQGAADAQIASARDNMDPFTGNLGSYGNQFFGQATTGAGMYNMGTAGMYGQAGALNDYAERGPGPSAAQRQLAASTALANRQQLAMAGSGRGQGGGASAFRQAAVNQAQISGQANAQAAMLRAQESQDWRQAQLAALKGAGDLYGQGAQAGAGYAQGMGNLASQSQQAAGALQQGTEALAHNVNMGSLSGSMGYEQTLNDIYGIDMGMRQGQSAAAAQERAANMALVGTGLTVAGGVAGTFLGPAGTVGGAAAGQAAGQAIQQSDIRSKENIQPADDDVARMFRDLGIEDRSAAPSQAEQFAASTGTGTAIPDLRGTSASSYDYKDPARHGQGRFAGPMAHELKSVPGVVKQGPDGTEAIDTSRLSLVNASATGAQQREQDETNDRLAQIEGLLGVEEDRPAARPKAKRRGVPRIEIGEAQIERPPVIEFGPAEIETPYTPDVGDQMRNEGPTVGEQMRGESIERAKAQAYSPSNITGPEPMGEYGYRNLREGRTEEEARDAAMEVQDEIYGRTPERPQASISRGPTQPTAAKVPRLGQSVGHSTAPTGLTEEEEDEIVREFFDPSERRRVYSL